MALGRQETRVAAAVALAIAIAGPAVPQAPLGEITPYRFERNADYEGALGFRRIQSDIVYVETRSGPIPLDAAGASRGSVSDRELSSGLSAGTRAILAALALAAIVLLLVRRRSWFAVFRRGPDGGHGPRAAPQAAAGMLAQRRDPTLIARLIRMPDRRAALVMLLDAVLGAAAEANGLRVGRSETARELFRRLPRDWPHLADLRRVIEVEELVQFGGRPLPETRFLDCLERGARILAIEGGPA